MSHHLRLFGYPALLDGEGVPQHFRSRKQLALLVYLALEARQSPVSREHLTELLWADVPVKRGRHSLSQGLSAIRGMLGEGVLSSNRFAVGLAKPPSTDMDLLTDSMDRLPTDLSRPLQGLDVVAGVAFGHWVDGARGRCLSTARRSLSGRLRDARSSGKIKRVHEHAAELYRVDPLSEAAVCALAEQSLLDGDVIGTKELLRSHLNRAQEAGKVQSPAISRLLRRVEIGLVRPPGAELLPPQPPGQRQAEVFVGRDAELSRLEAAWKEARHGKLVTCLVTGDAGIGKSSLLRRFATSVAARAAAVWEISCQGIGRNIPFAAVSDLIHSITRDSAVTGTDPLWLAEASRVCPGLREIYTGIPNPPPAPAESVRLRVAEALVRMQAAAADEGPMLLVVDDVGNLDAASRDVLLVLLHHLRSRAVMVVASSRTAIAQSLAMSNAEGTGGLDWDEIRTLAPLSLGQSQTLLDELAGTEPRLAPQIKATLTALAAGNPYLVEMLLSDWRRNGPESLTAIRSQGDSAMVDWQPPETLLRAFENQYRGLPDNAERAVNLLAVAGRRVPVSEISVLLDLSPAEADIAALEPIYRGILRVDEGHLVFKNQLHRDFVYGAMPDEVRRFHHHQIARIRQDKGDQGDFQQHLEAALHYDKAGALDLAIAALTLGARVAIERGAPEEAEGAIRRLLPHSGVEATQLKLLLAEALLVRGEHHEALATIAPITPRTLLPQEAVQRLVIQAEATHRGRIVDASSAAEAAQEAITAALEAGTEALQLRALQIGAEVSHESAEMQTVESIRSVTAQIGSETRSASVRSSAATTHAFCLMVMGEYREAASRFAEGADGFRALSRDADLRRALNGLGICLTTLGSWDPAIDCLLEGASLAHRIGDTHSESIQWDNLAVLYEDIGCFDEAVLAMQRAASLLRRSPRSLREAQLLANGASLAITLGNFEEASLFLDRAVAIARDLRLPTLTITMLVARADHYIAQQDFDRAWECAGEAMAIAQTYADRARRIGDFERVRRHFLWSTQGYDALLAAQDQPGAREPELRRSQMLELRAFDEWVNKKEGREIQNPSVTSQLVREELFGAIAHLAALHVYPGELPGRLAGETSAQLVRRVFPACRCESVPTSVGVLL